MASTSPEYMRLTSSYALSTLLVASSTLPVVLVFIVPTPTPAGIQAFTTEPKAVPTENAATPHKMKVNKSNKTVNMMRNIRTRSPVANPNEDSTLLVYVS
eukprot:TRINITY_DN78324_c0_g1_i1.p2 TRINITY_DN78324_c0_g1~~TRINITY_DN78324_c0_g1_i1.p2  ORF type:complete len:100 (+),score=15.24 TRINITY_DN78324_c0_g1_i1:108-407(+)